MDNFLVNMAACPEEVVALTEKAYTLHLANLEKWIGAVGPYIDVVAFGDDLGGQTGPLISPEMYRKYYKPYHEKLWRRAKDLAEVKVMLHSCGSIRAYLPDLIDAGLDAVNPVQITAAGMAPEQLKKDFGKHITFWGGGCDTRDILCRGAPDAITDHVRKQVSTMKSGGGFVFQQVHNIMADVPAENILAMFKALNN